MVNIKNEKRIKLIIDLIYAVILGIVEGITEWLPISSTAHIIIIEKLFYASKTPPSFSNEFLLMFDVVIQLGAIFAVVIIYFKKLYPFKYNDNEYDQKEKITIWLKVIISCIPVVIIGLLLDDFITSYFYNLFVIAITLILYGILFIVVENKNKKAHIKSIKNVGIKDAGIIGCAQVLSLIPGTSRSGVTILSGMLLGFDRTSSAEYSFYLSVPIMFGASIYKLIKYVFNFKIMMKEVIILVIGMIVAMLISLIVIKNLLNYIKKHGFKVFGIYRIILGIVILVIWSL